MIVNPFILSSDIPAKYFCDRERETEELISLIRNGNNVVLFSSRRMGKTGLILHCFDDERLKDDYYRIYIDILQTSSLREFVFLLGKAVFHHLAPFGFKILSGFLQALKSLGGKFSFDPFTGLPTFNINLGDIRHPELTLEEIFQFLERADRKCIVAIDEFQQITNYAEKNVEAILRSHIQLLSNANFIFSGSRRHILQEMFLSSARPFYSSASFINLDRIPEEIYVDFIKRNFQENGKAISSGCAESIYRKFEGHTFYVHRVCNVAFSYTKIQGECDEKTVDFAVEYILNSYEPIFRSILATLTERQKELLYAIASEGRATGLTSIGFIQKYSLPSASSVQSNTRILINKELITQEDSNYYVSDRFFGLWIRRMLS